MIAVIIFKLIDSDDSKYDFVVESQKTIYVLVFVINKSAFYEFILKFEVLFMLKSIVNDFKRPSVTHVKCLIVILFERSHFDSSIKDSITHSVCCLNDFRSVLH